MTLDQAMRTILVLGVLTYLIFGVWLKRKGKTSIYAHSSGLEDIAFSWISSIGNSHTANRLDDIVELRPTWGARLFTPCIAIAVLVAVDIQGLWNSLEFTSPLIKSAVFWICVGGFAYSWIMVMFVQRIRYDRVSIESWGTSLTRDKRELKDLIDIRVHKRRPALVLTFADQRPLFVPKFISKRGQFIADMEAVIAKNRANGITAPAPKRWLGLGR